MMVSFVNIFKFLILKMKKIFVLYNAALLRCLPIMTCFKPRIRRVWRVLVSAAAVKCCSISFQAKPRLHSFFIFQTRISNGLKSIFYSTVIKIDPLWPQMWPNLFPGFIVFFIVYFPTFSETLSFLEGLVDQGKVEVQVRGTIFFPEKKTFLQLFAVLQLRK